MQTHFSYFSIGPYGYPFSEESSPANSPASSNSSITSFESEPVANTLVQTEKAANPNSAKKIVEESFLANSPAPSNTSITSFESEPVANTLVQTEKAANPNSAKKIAVYNQRQAYNRTDTTFCINSIFAECNGKCKRAHHPDDLVPVPVNPIYKTEMCGRLYCHFGDRCHYIHSNELIKRKQETINGVSITTITISIYNMRSKSFVIVRKGFFVN